MGVCLVCRSSNRGVCLLPQDLMARIETLRRQHDDA